MHYDLVVIGTGTAASGIANQVRKAERRVAVVDFRPFGGTCALRGCDPKKVLLAGAQASDFARRMTGNGLTGEVAINWPELVGFKRSFTDPIPAMKEASFAEAGIDTFRGTARFTGRNALQIDGQAVTADTIVIATGAEPMHLGIPGEEHLRTHEDFLELDTLPHRVVFVGGGYIAAEFSHIAARAGAAVTVVQRGDRLLKPFDADLVGWLMDSFGTAGIDVRTETIVEAVEKTGSSFIVHTRSGDSEPRIDADLVVHAAGRPPALSGLDVEAADIAVEKGRLQLNDNLQSVSNEAVYAAGDAAQMGPPLTPVASLDAAAVAGNILRGNRFKPDYRGVPSVAFTTPAIAMVGLTEAAARQQGLKARTRCQRASDWYTARREGQAVYGYKTLVDEVSGRILGAHLVGPHAEEVINLFALAIRQGLTADDLVSAVFSYPSASSDIASML